MSINLLLHKFFRRLSGKTGGPALRYSSNGRSGYVHYESEETSFEMYYEFGGGNCVASINVPSAEDWEKATGLPLARREEVLDFIGRQVVKDQVSSGNGYFRVEGEWLGVFV